MTTRYCRCGSALARDNADRLCAACQVRRRRDRAPDVPPEFWQSESLADALASCDVGRVIRAYRCHPFHGERLPQALVGGWLNMSQPAVCRIETGRRRVTIDELRHIAQVLGMPPHRDTLGRPPAIGRGRGPQPSEPSRRGRRGRTGPQRHGSTSSSPQDRPRARRAICAMKEAHGHALAGDVVACERSLAGARDLLDRPATRT
jgi:transcriptional regulator with XRE-family HTH domain